MTNRRTTEPLSLREYVRQAWAVVEPATPFVPGWHIDAICEHLEAVTARQIRGLIVNIPPRHMKSLLVSVFWPTWMWTRWPATRFLTASYAQTLATRDAVKSRRLIQSPWYQQRWGGTYALTSDQNEKMRYENDRMGYRIATSTGGAATGEGGDVRILDDPHKVDEAQSDTVRDTDIDWIRETWSTRANDPATSVEVVVMQRLHERDATGFLLSEIGGYEHLMLPARFEPERASSTSLPWSDPRRIEGELLWGDRFDETALAELEGRLGSYGCTPAESPVLMGDLSLRPISEVRPGDTVVGFSPGQMRDDITYVRQRTRPSKVVRVFQRSAPVVRMTLDSGEVVRCTPDHKWYRKQRDGGSHYAPAHIGSPLTRVCPAQAVTLSPDEERLAGWLAGFFDGEGTVSYVDRCDNQCPVARIVFYQGAGRNGPLCEKLEHALSHFGFDYTISVDERKDPECGVNYEYRSYTLKGKTLPLMQRFLRIVQPTKWCDRFVSGAMTAKFRMGSERVIAIEPDGTEDVYALETETGNYVVWGLASSNSAGQLQQRPAPVGGGIFQREWFQAYSERPALQGIVQSWDTAFKKGEDNSYSVGQTWGLTPWGFYLLDQVRGRLEYPYLKRQIVAKAAQFHPSVILVEDKASGQSLVQDLAHDTRLPLVPVTPATGDKVVRARLVSATVEAKRVYVPAAAEWTEDYLQELSTFPASRHDDQVDATTQFLDWAKGWQPAGDRGLSANLEARMVPVGGLREGNL